MPPLPAFDPDLLLLTRRQDRHDAVAAALHRVWPELVLERTASAPQAARLALRGHLRLMLIDAAAGPDAGVGLAHHLARWRPDLPVLVLADDLPAATGLARPARWDRLDEALQHCLALPAGRGDRAR